MRRSNNYTRHSDEWVTGDRHAKAIINEYPRNEITGSEFVSVSVFPEDYDSTRRVSVGGPYHELYGVSVGHATLFLTEGEWNDLRNKVIESMVEDGELVNLTAEVESQLELEAVQT